MHKQSWLDNILGWTVYFFKGRNVRARISGRITISKELECCVRQGSSISAILFLLYLVEPMKYENFRARFGYADDIGILGTGRTVAESATGAQKEVDSLLEWVINNAVSFDSQKSEAIQLQGHR